jgi:predicted RNase H-like nuclease (RuvC/YqgF family)
MPCRVAAMGGGILLAISNALAWAMSVDVGATATAITILGGAICGVVALVISTVVTAWSKARAEAWATTERMRIAIKQEQERAEAESYTGQIRKLTTTIEDGNRKLQEATEAGTARVEDANRKLHDVLGQLQKRDAQIWELGEELQAARDEIRRLRDDLGRAHAEISRLMSMQGAQIANNKAAIEKIAAVQSDDDPPAAPGDPRSDHGRVGP